MEAALLVCLCDASLALPASSLELAASVSRSLGRTVAPQAVPNLLHKFATQLLIG